MSTTFENAKNGDKLWCLFSGWLTLVGRKQYPDGTILLQLRTEHSELWYQENGKLPTRTPSFPQTLFWDEIKYDIPEEPWYRKKPEKELNK